MSDKWETFPCTMGEHAAFISYDHGIREELEQLPFEFLSAFRVNLANRDERGLPHGAEFSVLNAIEDELVNAFGKGVGVQVGRITTNGYRYFYFYTSLPEAKVLEIARSIGQTHARYIDLRHKLDQDRSAYWNELYPTDDDMQVIQDMRVQEGLQREGDDLTRSREIEHWAYFPTEEGRESFLRAVEAEFSSSECFEDAASKHGRYAAKLRHVGLPDYRSMNRFSLLLSRAAKEAGGDYDGWETQVCRGDA